MDLYFHIYQTWICIFISFTCEFVFWYLSHLSSRWDVSPSSEEHSICDVCKFKYDLAQKILPILIPREFHVKQLCEVRPTERRRTLRHRRRLALTQKPNFGEMTPKLKCHHKMRPLFTIDFFDIQGNSASEVPLSFLYGCPFLQHTIYISWFPYYGISGVWKACNIAL